MILAISTVHNAIFEVIYNVTAGELGQKIRRPHDLHRPRAIHRRSEVRATGQGHQEAGRDVLRLRPRPRAYRRGPRPRGLDHEAQVCPGHRPGRLRVSDINQSQVEQNIQAEHSW